MIIVMEYRDLQPKFQQQQQQKNAELVNGIE